MTKNNIERAIGDFLVLHLELIPDIKRRELFDVKINRICLNEDCYTGKDWYTFTGEGEGWIKTIDGKSRMVFRILSSKALIAGDNNPIVEDVTSPVLFASI